MLFLPLVLIKGYGNLALGIELISGEESARYRRLYFRGMGTTKTGLSVRSNTDLVTLPRKVSLKNPFL